MAERLVPVWRWLKRSSIGRLVYYILTRHRVRLHPPAELDPPSFGVSSPPRRRPQPSTPTRRHHVRKEEEGFSAAVTVASSGCSSVACTFCHSASLSLFLRTSVVPFHLVAFLFSFTNFHFLLRISVLLLGVLAFSLPIVRLWMESKFHSARRCCTKSTVGVALSVTLILRCATCVSSKGSVLPMALF